MTHLQAKEARQESDQTAAAPAKDPQIGQPESAKQPKAKKFRETLADEEGDDPEAACPNIWRHDGRIGRGNRLAAPQYARRIVRNTRYGCSACA